MILTVTLNAAIDKGYVVDGFRIGEVNRVKECTYTPGGKGLNQSIALAKVGVEVYHAGLVGPDGEMLRDVCREYGVDVRYIRTVNKPPGGS